MAKNIMLAFVSPVSEKTLSEPITYPDVQGRPYTAIQTNESAIICVERMLGESNSLAKIFLIVSDFVRENKVPTENEFGDVTHLEFLMRRVTKECPQLSGKFEIENYSEEGNGSTKLEMNILQTARIAEAITTFANNHTDEKIKVHADMTGGFRHTSMFMLSIIQLLKYRGVEIGEVFYSEPAGRVVYRMTEIQRMFSLITGADEFVRFGSVEVLQEYFGTNPPQVVGVLLEAMNHFSEAIKICRTNAIESELKNLGQHIKIFREHPDKDLKSELFAKIIDTIEREYGLLIGNTADRLEIIRWCMKKGFWQQAMTLCTEWLPEEIVKRKICIPVSSSVQTTCESKSRSANKTWQQYFVIDYVYDKDCCGEIRYILENFSSKKVSGDEKFNKLKNFLDEFVDSEISFELCKHGKIPVNAFRKNFPVITDVLQTIYDERKKSPTYKKNFYQFLQTVSHTLIPKFVANFSNKKILELFETECDEATKKISTDDEKSDNREREYRRMFDAKIIRLKPDIETALKILRGYHEIRRERNQVNHANAQASKTISELKIMIENYLDDLENLSVAKKNTVAFSSNG